VRAICRSDPNAFRATSLPINSIDWFMQYDSSHVPTNEQR